MNTRHHISKTDQLSRLENREIDPTHMVTVLTSEVTPQCREKE
jgi:hypothetical protein